MVFELPPRAYVSRLRTQWDYKNYRWVGIKPLSCAGAYRTSLREILPDGIPDVPMLGWIGSTQFPDELREEIVETLGYNATKDEVLLTPGTSGANFLAIVQSLNAGDEAIMDNPSWFQFRLLPPAIGAKLKVIQRKEENGWKFDVEELKEAITPKTKLIMINSPNNPTGTYMTPNEMKAVCEIANDRGVRLLVDEVYKGLEWDAEPLSAPTAVNYSNTAVTTSSPGKTLALVGCKIGWLVTHDKDFMNKCYRLLGWGFLHLNLLGKMVVTAAMQKQKFHELLEKKRKIGKENWSVVSDWMKKRTDVFNWSQPKAGFLSFPRYNLKITSKEFCDRMWEEPYRTCLEAGGEYGLENHLRLGVGSSIRADNVSAALEQVGKFVDTLRQKVPDAR